MVNDTYYTRCITSLIAERGSINIVQIGANDGKINDPIYDAVLNNKKNTKILLIEPQAEILSYLQDNYASHPDARIWNGAIGPDGILQLYRVKPSFWDIYIKKYLKDTPAYRVPSGFTSSSLQHVINHARGNFPQGIDSSVAIEKIQVRSMNLQSVLSDFFPDFLKVDIIQIDTEGMDDVVIMNSNIDAFQPAMINFEHVHLSQDAFFKVASYLEAANYTLIRWSKDDTLAISNNFIIP